MDSVQKQFSIEVSNDRMSAMLHCTDVFNEEPVDETALKQFIVLEGIRVGINKEAIDQVISGLPKGAFPINIAQGIEAQDGSDGEIECFFETSNERIKNSEEYDFREVMKIPSVEKGAKLAVIHPPSAGEPGEDIFGVPIPAKDGKKVTAKAGKNVRFDVDTQTFFAQDTGQATLHAGKVHVYSVYEIYESVSMKTGNVQFAGSIVIHGDVPSGFKVRANGDVKVFGMVEAASITAGGSVFIEEGFSGMKKGVVTAGRDVHLGYINQGTVLAGHDIVSVNSILHSNCTASGKIESLKGSIIGGTASAGTVIDVKEIGNRHNTKTDIHFGLDEENESRLEQLREQKKDLLEKAEKVEQLGKQIEDRDYENNVRLRIARLRQRNKHSQLMREINNIKQQIVQLEELSGKEKDSALTARTAIFSNTTISFGKYKQRVDKDYGPISVVLEQNEIYFRPLS